MQEAMKLISECCKRHRTPVCEDEVYKRWRRSLILSFQAHFPPTVKHTNFLQRMALRCIANFKWFSTRHGLLSIAIIFHTAARHLSTQNEKTNLWFWKLWNKTVCSPLNSLLDLRDVWDRYFMGVEPQSLAQSHATANAKADGHGPKVPFSKLGSPNPSKAASKSMTIWMLVLDTRHIHS